MHDTVLVPLDGSEFGECALGTAAVLAKRSGARLELLHVHQRNLYSFDLDLSIEKHERDDERSYLKGVCARLRRETGIEATPTWLEGLPAKEICDRARAVRDPVIVMSTHGRTGLSRSWLGSVADAVVRHSSVPVLTIRPSEGDASRGASMASSVQRLLVPLDGSDAAATILPHATWLAEAMGAEIVLLRVVEPVYAPVPAVPMPYTPSPLMQATLETLVQRSALYMTDVTAELRRTHPELVVEYEVEVGDSPSRLIIERAQARNADAVAMATHRHGLSRLVVHSVADKVLRGGPPLVLLVHAESD